MTVLLVIIQSKYIHNPNLPPPILPSTMNFLKENQQGGKILWVFLRGNACYHHPHFDKLLRFSISTLSLSLSTMVSTFTIQPHRHTHKHTQTHTQTNTQNHTLHKYEDNHLCIRKKGLNLNLLINCPSLLIPIFEICLCIIYSTVS